MKQKKKQKKKWVRPILTVLVRGDRQERVLDACKASTPGGGWPETFQNACESSPDCSQCYSPVDS